jgi:hypothetical protein
LKPDNQFTVFRSFIITTPKPLSGQASQQKSKYLTNHINAPERKHLTPKQHQRKKAAD